MTKEELESKINASSLDELIFMLAQYGGRNRSILRDKAFGESSDILEKLLKHSIEYRSVEDYLLSDS